MFRRSLSQSTARKRSTHAWMSCWGVWKSAAINLPVRVRRRRRNQPSQLSELARSFLSAMKNKASIAALLELLRERSSFVISSHLRPDGDAIGSALGLMHLLEAMGKQVTVCFVDPVPANFRFLDGSDRVASTFPPVDAAIFLECDSIERSSIDRRQFEAASPALTINIDHHRSGREFANFNWIDPEAAP